MKTVHVAVGVICDAQRRVLVSLRPSHVHQGGLWEFPGGKCEPGEDVHEALTRELQEELGIQVLVQAPLCRIAHDYGDKRVLLDVRRVLAYGGEPQGREGQPVRWADMASLNPEEFPAANRPIIQRIQLPDRIAITAQASSVAALSEQVDHLLQQRVPCILVRQTQFSAEDWRTAHSQLLPRVREAGISLFVHAVPDGLDLSQVDGLHLNDLRARRLSARPVPQHIRFGVSCHGLDALLHAQRIGADYAFLSPVMPTPSHPEASPLGWEQFADLITRCDLPIYALGGMTMADIPRAQLLGAAGIAAISAFTA